MERTGWITFGLGLVVAASCAWAGGGPWNTLVVVNDNSPVSQELGQYYQDVRGLPEHNLVHVRTTTNYTTTLAVFTNDVVHPVRAYLASAGLSNQIDYIVLTRDLPYRVFDGGISYNGSSAILFYGFKTDGPLCSLPGAAFHDYYQSEQAFGHERAPSSNRYFASTLLTGYDLDQARRAVDRAAEADALFPTGQVALLHTADNHRTVRWTQFDDALFTARFLSNGVDTVAYDADGLVSVTNLAGYFTGVANEPFINTLGFVPGALADHLTSYGGCLFDPGIFTPFLQMPALNWIRQGAAGSYGNVAEPCNFPEKYPHARLHFWYGRGFNLAESYTMSVKAPYMGLMLGDPLTAPYARPPDLVVTGLTAGAVISNDVELAIRASSTSLAGRVSRVEVVVDGRWSGTATNRGPASGNQITVTIAGSNRMATVQVGDTLERVAARLAEAINDPPAFPYTAQAFGDRVQIVQDTLGTSGTWIQVSAAASTGSASRLDVLARSVFTNFMESPVAAKEGLLLEGSPASGDVVRVVVTRLDAVVVTNEVVAVAGDTDATLIIKLRDSINGDTNLNLAAGCEAKWPTHLTSPKELWLVARTNGWRGYNLLVTYSIVTNVGSTLDTVYAFSDNFNDNADALGARANVFLTEGETNLQASWSLAVTNLPDGPHEVTVVAYEGSAVRTQGRLTIPFVVDRHNLTCAITNLVAGRYVWRGGAVTAEVAAASPGVVTQVALWVEGKLAAVTAGAPYHLAWITTNYGSGRLGVQAQAWDDAGRSTLSERLEVNLVTDDDSDALPDQWEYTWLGGMTNGSAGDDPDADGLDNRGEFLALTDPRNGASGLAIASLTLGDPLAFALVVNTHRTYRVEVNDDALSGTPWSELTLLTPVTNGTLGWTDAPTNGLRFYRVRADLP